MEDGELYRFLWTQTDKVFELENKTLMRSIDILEDVKKDDFKKPVWEGWSELETIEQSPEKKGRKRGLAEDESDSGKAKKRQKTE